MYVIHIMCAMCIFVIYYISFSGEPCLIYYMHLNLYHHHRINFYSLNPLYLFCTQHLNLLLIHLLLSTFTVLWFGLEVGFHIPCCDLLQEALPRSTWVCFLPRSTWILLNLLCVLPQDCGMILLVNIHIYNSPLWRSSFEWLKPLSPQAQEPRSLYLAVWLSAND